jgi:hypothetical protein
MKHFLEKAFYLGNSQALLTFCNFFGLVRLSSFWVLPPTVICHQWKEQLLLPMSILEFRGHNLLLTGLLFPLLIYQLLKQRMVCLSPYCISSAQHGSMAPCT